VHSAADASRPTATTVTNANSTCDEMQAIHPFPTWSDNNADFPDVGIESLVSLILKTEHQFNTSM